MKICLPYAYSRMWMFWVYDNDWILWTHTYWTPAASSFRILYVVFSLIRFRYFVTKFPVWFDSRSSPVWIYFTFTNAIGLIFFLVIKTVIGYIYTCMCLSSKLFILDNTSYFPLKMYGFRLFYFICFFLFFIHFASLFQFRFEAVVGSHVYETRSMHELSATREFVVC